MDNLIKLTPNGEYIGVVIPKDAYNIDVIGLDLWYGRPSETHWTTVAIPIGAKLIGILGESISEEQAREIVKDGMVEHPEHGTYFEMYDRNDMTTTALESLKSLVESKGIKDNEILVVIKCKV